MKKGVTTVVSYHSSGCNRAAAFSNLNFSSCLQDNQRIKSEAFREQIDVRRDIWIIRVVKYGEGLTHWCLFDAGLRMLVPD